MYKVIGTNNAEYGPVSAEKIREWIKEGRANAQTKGQSEGSTDWKTLSEFPEFADALPPNPGAPPVLPTIAPPQAKTSGLAIASLVLGLLGWLTLGLTGIVGLVLGIVALVKISRSQGRLRGTGLALAGTIVSGAFILVLPILAALLLPALAQAKVRAQSIACMNNLKQLGLGCMMYASDNKDQFPTADNWCDALGKYVASPKTFQCPAGDPRQRCHYAFNSRLSEIPTKNVMAPAETVLLFEVDGGWNVNGGDELILKRPRHRNAVSLVFADGHCEIAREARLRNLRWEP